MKKIFLILVSFLLIFGTGFSLAKEEDFKIYLFYGQGCPHCAQAEEFLDGLEEEYPEIKVERYEVYLHPENVQLFKDFCSRFNIEPKGVPTIFVGEKYFVGFGKTTGQEIEDYIQEILQEDNPLEEIPMEAKVAPENVPLAEGLQPTLTKVLSLAAVDAINPCALVVLALMLITILTYNPDKKGNILLAGLAFVSSVFVMYLVYGLVIIKSFQLVQALTFVRLWLYKILGGGAVVLGCFQIKNFFQTKAVCKVSPKVDKIISKVTSPKGALGVGAFVTIFLLPCTIGPYIICGGILCPLGILKALPWLLFYNLVFVLPMLAVVLLIYLGLSKIEDISTWQAKNMKYLDLVSGLIILGLGAAMLLGLA